MMSNFPKLSTIDVSHKRIFLRADLNVSFDDQGIIIDESRLQALKPTLDYLIDQSATIILATHIGRPTAGTVDASVSTKLLMPWFKDNNYETDHHPDLKKAFSTSILKTPAIIVLENLRFFKGEKIVNDDFAFKLSELADCYVNDAFAVMHRTDTSVTLLPKHFDKDKRAFGLLVEKELTALHKLRDNPAQPYVIVMGGAKADEKIGILEKIITTSESYRPAIICAGGLVGLKLLERDDIRSLAQQHNISLLLPRDHNEGKTDIGPQTIDTFCTAIQTARTLFINGTMGMYEKGDEAGTKKILECIAGTDAIKVAGGGDAVASIHHYGFAENFDFLSTGGGATLAFLASNEPEKELPGLAAIL